MSLSTEEYLEFCTDLKPTKILKYVTEACWLEGGKTDKLNGAVTTLFLQGFISKSTHKRYYRLFLRIKNKEAMLRRRK